MAITFGVATAAGTATAQGRSGDGTFTITLPTSWAAGQLAVALVYLDAGTCSISGGWNIISGAPWGSATPKLYAFTRFLVSGDSDPTITVTGSATGDQAVGAIMTFNGVDKTTPVDAVGTASAGTGTPMTAGAISTIVNGAWAIGLCGRGDNEAASGQSFGGSTTGVTERLDAGNAAGNDGQVSAYSKEIASAGSTGNGSATTSVTDPWVSVLISLKPGTLPSVYDATTVTDVNTVAIQEATPRSVNVYDSVTTDSVNSTVVVNEPVIEDVGVSVFSTATITEYITVSNSLLEVLAFSAVTVGDFTDNVVSALNVSAFDTSGITEYFNVTVSNIAVYAFSTSAITEYVELSNPLLALEVFDSASVAEYNNEALSDLAVVAYDSTALTENYTVYRAGGEVIIEDIEIFYPLAVSVFELSQLTDGVVFETLLANILIDLLDTVSISEHLVGEESDLKASVFEGCIVEEFCLTEVSVLLVNAYDSVAVSEWLSSNVGDLSAIAYSTTSCYDTAVVTVSDLILIAYESISVTEYFIVFPEVQGTVSGTDGVQVADVPILTVSDPQVSVSDLIAVSEQAQAAFSHMLAVSDSTTVTEQIVATVSALQLVVVDSISVTEYVSYLSDYAISIYDNAVVVDLGIVQIGIAAVVYDSISATSVSFTYIVTEINVEDSVVITEDIGGGSSDLDISVGDVISVIDVPEVYWIIASGVLVLDVDIIIPLCGVEVMVPVVSVEEFIPSCDVELKSPSVNIYAMLPTIDLEMQT